MAIHPIEFRYGRPEMKNVWSEESRLQKVLSVEVALAYAHSKVGNISKSDYQKIKSAAKKVKLARVKQIEDQINHDMMAIVKALAEKSGTAGKYVHLGATSNDIFDTATSLQFRDALELLRADLFSLKKTLLSLSSETKNLVCIGRTHGQHAVPTTYGLRFAIWAQEINRHLDRIVQLFPRLLVGQMNGAVGTGAAFGNKATQIQDIAIKMVGLKPVTASNQIIQRDRHGEFLLFMSLVAETLNKIGVNIRSWQRTEIGEVYENFDVKKQVGSSTMPHKKNPIRFEQICGLSRIVTGNAFAQLRNISLWDERDLTNSAPERITFLESTIILDHILNNTTKGLDSLGFNKEKIEQNLNMTKGLIMAERIMMALAEKGASRQDSHELIRKIAMKCYSSDKQFSDLLKSEKKIAKYLSENEIDKLMDPHTYTGSALKTVEKTLKELK
ncbi:adenylosuccinate lyase [Candidatus Undinarchaeota archaeon]